MSKTPALPLPSPPPPAPPGSAYDPAQVEEKWYAFWERGGFFHADEEKVNSGEKEPFVIAMPPPNVTGRLHMGHALQDTVQDLLTRMKRMQGFEALWIPGLDHAGIATQNVVERKLKKEGQDRKEMGREAFLEHVWKWKEEYGDIILQQKRRLGDSCSWDRTRFTMDDGLSRAVQEVFVRLHTEGLVYRGDYLVNWDPDNQTVISNEEVDNVERDGHLWYVAYPVVGESGEPTGETLTVATTRPETIPADTAVAVHPDDERFAHLVGRELLVPLTGRRVPIIADDYIKMDFGAGALKVTPGHDENDFEIGRRHDLATISLMNLDGSLNENAGPYKGLDRVAARKAIVADLDQQGFLVKVEDYKTTVPISSRSKAVIEPLLSPQWYVAMKPLAEKALAVVDDGTVTFHPARWANEYRRWMDDIRDWPISRQLWWGHRIPVWYPLDEHGERDEEAFVVSIDSPGDGYEQDEDVLDTWFSSWLWPFATLGWPEKTPALQAFYPGTVLVSGYDILFFWIARMIMAGTHFTGEAPFRDVFITGMIKDKQGRWMSKSLGNGIDPLDMIGQYGADAVRFTLATLCTPGQDIKLDPAKFENGRNFANKLWNAFNVFGRFLETGEEGDAAGRPTHTPSRQRAFAELDLHERWLMTRLQDATASIDQSMERYRVSEAAQTAYDVTWRDFCDWFLELAKPAPGEEMERRAARVCRRSLRALAAAAPPVHALCHGRALVESPPARGRRCALCGRMAEGGRRAPRRRGRRALLADPGPRDGRAPGPRPVQRAAVQAHRRAPRGGRAGAGAGGRAGAEPLLPRTARRPGRRRDRGGAGEAGGERGRGGQLGRPGARGVRPARGHDRPRRGARALGERDRAETRLSRERRAEAGERGVCEPRPGRRGAERAPEGGGRGGGDRRAPGEPGRPEAGITWRPLQKDEAAARLARRWQA